MTKSYEKREIRIVVWQSYQRRSEMLAMSLEGATVRYYKNRFTAKWFRPLDYCLKFAATTRDFLRFRPSVAILQAPPLFSAFSAVLTKTPYVVDAHNGMFQSFWGKIPSTRWLLMKAMAVVVHNTEIAELSTVVFPGLKLIVIPDPVKDLSSSVRRDLGTVFFICSFDRDEPVDLIVDVITALPQQQFTITANVRKLTPLLGRRLLALPNVRLTGFLSLEEYEGLLRSSKVAVVLSTQPSVQPSGAVEALSSDTPLVVSKTSLSEKLFGEWASLTENVCSAVVSAIEAVDSRELNLAAHRERWNREVDLGIEELKMIVWGPKLATNSAMGDEKQAQPGVA